MPVDDGLGEAAVVLDSSVTALLDAVPTGIVIADAAGRITYVNAEAASMFGYARAELPGTSIDALLPERFRGRHAALRQGYLGDAVPRRMGIGQELFGQRKDGSEFPLEVGLNAFTTTAGIQVIASIVDNSERRRLEASARRIIQAVPSGVLIVDDSGTIVFANDALRSIFGYEPDELVGRPLEVLLPERYRQSHVGVRAAFAEAPELRAMGAGRDLTGLHRNRTEVPIEIGLSPIEWAGDQMVVATINDISARKAMELELRQKNADLEEFTFVASHDLRSPLRGISDLLDWIEEDLGDATPPEIKHNIGRAKLRVDRMDRLTEELLNYARAGKAGLDVTEIDIPQLIQQVEELQSLPDGIALSVDCRVQSIQGVAAPLHTVLRNLIGNAIKHHDRAEGRIEVHVEEEGSFCVFSVSDDGPGIPEKAHRRVFQLFQTLAGNTKDGAGMGLSVSKRLIESHGGRIAIVSNGDERGCTFRFWWPRFARKDLHAR